MEGFFNTEQESKPVKVQWQFQVHFTRQAVKFIMLFLRCYSWNLAVLQEVVLVRKLEGYHILICIPLNRTQMVAKMERVFTTHKSSTGFRLFFLRQE